MILNVRRIRRDQDGNNWYGMAPFVKVLEIESVVFDLFDRRCSVLGGSDLELQDKNDIPSDEESVDAFPHARNVKLKEDMSVMVLCESGLQDYELLKPCASLLVFKSEGILRGKSAEEPIGVFKKELRYASAVEGANGQ